MTDLKRILHVDDDDDIRTLTKMAFELVGGFEVEQFASGEDALKAAHRVSPQLLVLDYMMPGMSGLELWRRFGEVPHLRGVPVVFITAKSEHAFAKDLLEQGALSVIVKPFDINELCSMIAKVWSDHMSL